MSDIVNPHTAGTDVEVMKISHLVKHFTLKGSGWFLEKKKVVRAVDDVSFSIAHNEVVGLAGESGCGKSTVARLLLQLIPSTSGEILFHGQNLTNLNPAQVRALRPKMQMVFQDPYTSLNPRTTVGEIVTAPLSIHTQFSTAEKKKKMCEMLEQVGMSPDLSPRYPHEFSGGQRQRIAIARALIMRPQFLILDEPTSALDVSVQAVIVNLLKQLQVDLQLSCLFITHDLNLLRFMTHRLAIMYLGQIVEMGTTAPLFAEPLHPYSKALIASTPQPNPKYRLERQYLEGEIPSATNPPSGCRFHTRCPQRMGSLCDTQAPPLVEFQGRLVRCHKYSTCGAV